MPEATINRTVLRVKLTQISEENRRNVFKPQAFFANTHKTLAPRCLLAALIPLDFVRISHYSVVPTTTTNIIFFLNEKEMPYGSV